MDDTNPVDALLTPDLDKWQKLDQVESLLNTCLQVVRDIRASMEAQPQDELPFAPDVEFNAGLPTYSCVECDGKGDYCPECGGTGLEYSA